MKFSSINLNQPGIEQPGGDNPALVSVGAAEERSSNAASDAVVNANTVFIDDVAARLGRHG